MDGWREDRSAREDRRRLRGALALVAVAMAMVAGLTAAFAMSLRAAPVSADAEVCRGWRDAHPEWIFCDDFESDAPLRAPDRYFEYGDAGGNFVPQDGAGVDGSRGMRARFLAGAVGAGGMKLAFGRNPNGYMNSALRPTEDFREVWYRMDLRMQEGWVGDPAKLSRATVFTHPSDWSQAMIAHLWGDGKNHLLVDPVRCVDGNGRVKCKGYNDFSNMSWLGYKPGETPIFDTDRAGSWHAVETHVRLNDPGRANGVQEFWIDGRLEARREGLDFVGTYTDYALNAIFFENYWNDGSPVEQERYFDNIVVSAAPIGALGDGAEPTVTAAVEATVAASATATGIATSAAGATATAAATARATAPATATRNVVPTASPTSIAPTSNPPARSVLALPRVLRGR